jgi:hypothetical protein
MAVADFTGAIVKHFDLYVYSVFFDYSNKSLRNSPHVRCDW